MTTLCGAPVSQGSKMEGNVALSALEAEGNAVVRCVQDMLYVKRLLESIGLKVKVPMIVESDSKSFIDLFNNWSVGGRSRHADLRLSFLRELKEDGILDMKWRMSETMTCDTFTKNLEADPFNYHVPAFCGFDQYHPGEEWMKEYEEKVQGRKEATKRNKRAAREAQRTGEGVGTQGVQDVMSGNTRTPEVAYTGISATVVDARLDLGVIMEAHNYINEAHAEAHDAMTEAHGGMTKIASTASPGVTTVVSEDDIIAWVDVPRAGLSYLKECLKEAITGMLYSSEFGK